ncbi:MAG TPA: UvrD-helicase domain-containing protein [Mycobacteriales bacterium]|nr:UvrD-helicase domain-containing protein [Mycobacteriales bacterium]
MSEADAAQATGAIAHELAVEQRYVDVVYERFEVLRKEMEQLESEGHERAQLGHEGGLFERDVLVLQAARRMRQLDRAHEGLVFGRMDLDGGETRYVGRVGLRDERLEPLTIDWRAPAAAAFYQATAHRRHGVVRRRVIDCRRQRVIAIEDDLLAPELAPDTMQIVGDGSLMAALSRSRTGEMRDIVATIQREQDEAVRAPGSGATLITGGPGTGKTAVALHRAAYLLYQERRRFERGGVLIVGPSSVFMRFIDRVLPSLGESATTLAALGGLVEGIATDRRDPPDVGALKGSARMRSILSKAVRLGPAEGPQEFRMMFRGRLLRLQDKDLLAIRRSLLARNRRYHTVRADVPRAVIAALWPQYAEADESDAPIDAAEFREQIADRDEITDFVAAWWPVLDPRTVLGWLSDPAYLRRCSGRGLSPAEIERLSGSWAGGVVTGRITVEDVALLDELLGILGWAEKPPARPEDVDEEELYRQAYEESFEPAQPGELAYREPERYAHIVVDEAQDLSPMQWRMLARRGPQASWTIVGDPMQSVWTDDADTVEAMNTALRRSPRRQYRLDVNYRNPAEIFAVAEHVIRRTNPAAPLPRAVRITGREPQHRTVTAAELPAAVEQAVRSALNSVDGTVAVIGPAQFIGELRRWAPGRPDARLSILSARECKGLEFDAVIVVEAGRIIEESPVGERFLYVALSRATQRLVTISTDESWRT